MGLSSLLTGKRRSAGDPVNLASPEFKANPYPYYARLRAEAPVSRVMLPTREPAWLITRYDDAVTVLKDERFVKDTSNAMTPEQAAGQPWFRKAFKALKRNLLDIDPPDHRLIVKCSSESWTPRIARS